jgi:hypothetical protein
MEGGAGRGDHLVNAISNAQRYNVPHPWSPAAPLTDFDSEYTVNNPTYPIHGDEVIYIPMQALNDVGLCMYDNPVLAPQMTASQMRYPTKSFLEVAADYRWHWQRMTRDLATRTSV